MSNDFIPENEVKRKLHEIGPLKGFKVVFMKKDGSLRTIFGSMGEPKDRLKDIFDGDVGSDFKTAVPVIEESTGQFRSFRVDSVIEIVHND